MKPVVAYNCSQRNVSFSYVSYVKRPHKFSCRVSFVKPAVVHVFGGMKLYPSLPLSSS